MRYFCYNNKYGNLINRPNVGLNLVSTLKKKFKSCFSSNLAGATYVVNKLIYFKTNSLRYIISILVQVLRQKYTVISNGIKQSDLNFDSLPSPPT